MSVERDSPSPPPRHPSRRQTQNQQVLRQSVSTASLKSSRHANSSKKQTRQRSSSYTVHKRDILYRVINEYQLTGSKLSSYADLLPQLGFDLSPLELNGQTWFLCCGKREDRSPCRRMVPEMYMRTSIGQVLEAAANSQLSGDALVADLADALSYAICSEHHTVHKVVRATECLSVIRRWRREGISADTDATTPTIRRKSPGPAARERQQAVEVPTTPRGNSPATRDRIRGEAARDQQTPIASTSGSVDKEQSKEAPSVGDIKIAYGPPNNSREEFGQQHEDFLRFGRSNIEIAGSSGSSVMSEEG